MSADPHNHVTGTFFVAACNNDIQAVRCLLGQGNIDVNAWYDDVRGIAITALHAAAVNNAKETAELLLNAGADVNARGIGGIGGATPLHVAILLGHTGFARILLDHGVDVNAALNGRTPLHIAVQEDLDEAVRHLLEAGADVNARDIGDAAPLHLALFGGHTGIAMILLDHGVDVNAAIKGYTPLHMAAQDGRSR